MAESIIQGLFGLTPYQIQQQQYARNEAQANSAAAAAGQTPGQIMARSYSRMGSSIADMGTGMLGMQTPEMADAQRTQQIFSQSGGLETPEQIRAAADRFRASGDMQRAFALIQLANQREGEMQKIASEQARAERDTALAEAALRDKSKPPASVQEYEFAITQGYRGTYEQWVKDKAKAGASSTTVSLPGSEKVIDIQKFRSAVQDTIKTNLEQINAADVSMAALQQAMKGNFIAFQGAQQQLARAFSDQNISKGEVAAAGGDPSLVGASVDMISKMITGTPSLDTMKKMEATLRVARKNAAAKAREELKQQREIGLMAGIKPDQLNTLLKFNQIEEKQGELSPGQERVLKSGKKVQRID